MASALLVGTPASRATGVASLTCDLYASTSGSDSNPGTQAQPFRTVAHLAGRLAASQAGCLLGGTFVESVSITSGGAPGNPITITSAPGYRATIKGTIVVRDTANDVVISDLVLNGKTIPPHASPQINGDRVALVRDDITNEHTDICVILGSGFEEGRGRAEDVLLEGNRVHDCGRLPSTGHEHGIYVEAADRVSIVDNAVYDNADYGIHLYPDSDGGIVRNNVVDGNGMGLIFAGEKAGEEYPVPYSSDENVAEHNIVTNSSVRWNIESWWGGPAGTGNVARANCVWNGAMGNIDVHNGGVTLVDNITANPGYVDRASKDFRLQPGSPCAGALNSPLPTVALTNPRDGAAVKGVVTLTAEGSDDVSVAAVEFLVGDRLVSTDESPPYLASWDSSGLADGPILIAARATDGEGRRVISHSAVIAVDTEPPEPPNVDSGPESPATVGAATFTFSGREPGLGFVCRVDDAAFAGCTSPASYSDLAEGAHVFEVKARDSAGNESAPAAYSWAVDLAPAGAPLQKVAIGQFVTPIFLAGPPTDPSRLFVVERGGRILVVKDGATLAEPFLDISGEVSTDGERGLLSIAFAPDFAATGRVYFLFTDAEGDIRIEEIARSADAPDRADPSTRRLVLELPKRLESTSAFHNGGQLQFGADGFLYASVGDGATCNGCKGQSLDTWLGKILRIDPRPSQGQPYAVPADNPFVSRGGKAREIYAYGFRNPWRFSFDRATGDLVIGDVGQGAREEIDFAPGGSGHGANFGWACWEGTLKFSACDALSHVPPVLERRHDTDGACSVTGGYVVRDLSLLSLYGRYLYGDYCSDTLRSARLATPAAEDDQATTLDVPALASFGEDACGRLYALSLGTGDIYRLQSAAPGRCAPPTLTISDSTVEEGDGGTADAVFGVILSAASAEPVTVRFATTDDAARAGTDYIPTGGTLTFAPGERAKTIRVATNGDTTAEPDETFFVDLSNAGNASIADGRGRATIVDQDLAAVSIGDATVSEGEAGPTEAVFAVSLAAPATGPVTVAYATRDGSATAGLDYAAASGTVSFAAGETSRLLAVVVNGDAHEEANETFYIDLANPTNATLSDATGEGTIVNDDGNRPPSAVDDALAVDEDAAGTIPVLANDSDADGDSLTLTGKTDGANGNVACTPAGACTYTPNVNYNGVDSFTYTVGDGRGGSDTASVAVAIAPVNDAPHPHDDFVATPEDTPATFNVLANELGHDDDGDDLSVSSVAQPAKGTVSCTSAGSCRYSPAANVHGADSFVYTVTDAHGGFSNATVFVNVSAVNDPPTAADDMLGTAEDVQAALNVLLNDRDADGDELLLTTPAPAAVHGRVACASGGRCTYTPNAGFIGPDSFAYTASDGHGGSATATVVITVAPFARPAAEIAPATAVEGGAGSTVASFTVSLSSASPRAASVRYATADGSATAGADYEATAGTLQFAAGETSKTLQVRILGDRLDEPDETFTVRLTDPVGLALAVDAARGTIRDDDKPTTRRRAAGPLVGVGTHRLTATPLGFVAVRLSAPSTAGRVRGKLTLDALVGRRAPAGAEAVDRRLILGAAPFAFRAGGIHTVRVKLTRSAMKVLRRERKLRARVTIVARDGPGARRTSRAAVTLLAPPRTRRG